MTELTQEQRDFLDERFRFYQSMPLDELQQYYEVAKQMANEDSSYSRTVKTIEWHLNHRNKKVS